MKTNLPAALRLLSLAFTLLASTSLVTAGETTPDRAAQKLASAGSVVVASVGPYVEIGTFRVQVAAKLGQPDARLGDGTWLYHQRRVAGSDAEGTLVIGFIGGRVQSLAVVTPAVAAALRKRTPGTGATEFVAAK